MNAIPIMVFVPAIFSVLPGRAAASLKKNHEIFSVTPVTSIHVSCCIMLTAVIGIVSILAFYLIKKIKQCCKRYGTRFHDTVYHKDGGRV